MAPARKDKKENHGQALSFAHGGNFPIQKIPNSFPSPPLTPKKCGDG
jgi:hypothetical protein